MWNDRTSPANHRLQKSTEKPIYFYQHFLGPPSTPHTKSVLSSSLYYGTRISSPTADQDCGIFGIPDDKPNLMAKLTSMCLLPVPSSDGACCYENLWAIELAVACAYGMEWGFTSQLANHYLPMNRMFVLVSPITR